MKSFFETILNGEFGIIHQISFLIIGLVFTFSFVTKQCERKRNKKAFCKTITFLKTVERKFRESNHTGGKSSPRTIRIVYWADILLCVLFSSWFYLYGLTNLAKLIISGMTGLNAMLYLLIIFAILIIGNMYRVSARRAKDRLDSDTRLINA